MKNRTFVFVACILTLGLLGSTASAQAPVRPIYTYVAEWGVPRAQWAAMEKSNAEEKAAMDALVANGTLIGYGYFENRVHSDGGYTHGSWFQATSVGNILKALESFYAQPDRVTSGVQAASKHQDYLMVANVYAAKPVSNATGYLRVVSVAIRPGEQEEFLDAYNRYIKPVYDKLLADGAIVSYQLDAEFNIQNAPGRFFSAIVMPNADAVNQVNMAFAQMFAANPAALNALMDASEPNSRMDILARVTAMTRK
jgi:hypothetical protein